MKRYFATYNLYPTNPLDARQLVICLRAESEDNALQILIEKIKNTDKRDWNIKEMEVIAAQPIEALIILSK